MPQPVTLETLSRRSFLISSGAFSALLLLGPQEVSAAESSLAANAWVTVGQDGAITIVAPAAEMGQGVMTSLPLILAEEMDADWSQVKIAEMPQDSATYGNPAFAALFGSPQLVTVSSLAVTGYYEKLRFIGAQARKVMMTKAAAIWKVPVSELDTVPSQVIHPKTGRTMRYGEIAAHPAAAGPVPNITAADLKPASRFRLIGRDVGRLDLPSKVNGTAHYAIDMQLSGMLYACVIFPEVQHARPEVIDDAAAKAVAGVLKVVPLPSGVGVIAESIEAAMSARQLLKVKWSADSGASDYDSDLVRDEFQRLAADRNQPATSMVAAGDAGEALGKAATVLTADFFSDHVAHMQMEPLNVTVKVEGDRIDIWSGNQGPGRLKLLAAQLGKTSPDKVNVHSLLLGGAFGRRFDGDDMLMALQLAQAVPGRPVKMIWLREDDLRNDKLRPLTAQRIEVGLDTQSNIVAWRHRIVNDSYVARIFPPMPGELRDDIAAGGGEFRYAIPNHKVEWVRAAKGVDVGAWRGIGAGYAKFAIETLIDEIAVRKDMDPLAYRLSLMDKVPRAAAVLKKVAEMAHYNAARKEGRALGIAYSDALQSYTAAIAEVSIDRATGEITVHQLWAAVDAGTAVQPENIVAQVTGGMVQGLGAALKEQMSIKGGVMQATNFDGYPVLRMSEVPPIEVAVISTDNPPSGIGEAGVPPVAPAIANAVAKLTGKRLRHLPMTPDRVQKILHEKTKKS